AGAQGLIIGPVDTKAIIPALDYAQSKKVPVVTTDKGPSGGHVAMIVRADNLLMGKLDCEAVGKAIGGQGKVISLDGDLADLNGRHKDRRGGQPGHTVLASIDGTPQALAAIRKKQLDVLVSQPLTDYGKWGVWYIQQVLAGNKFAPGKTTHGSHIILFKGNLMDLLPSPVVTAANV